MQQIALFWCNNRITPEMAHVENACLGLNLAEAFIQINLDCVQGISFNQVHEFSGN